jgi:hypothetical protein
MGKGIYSETTRRYIPEGSTLHTHRRENLKSHTVTEMSDNTHTARAELNGAGI